MPVTQNTSHSEWPARLLAGSAAAAGEVAVIAAHPDDETVGLGARLPRLREATFVYVTDGAPRDGRDARAAGCATRQAYARARREEALRALGLAGVAPDRVRFWDCADQEASLHLADLARRTAALLRARRPDVVVTHPYEGGHPDHDATAFAVHTACRLLATRGAPVPAVVEMTSYHLRDGAMATGTFLPATHGGERGVLTRVLSEPERALKRRLMGCYATQERVLRRFPIEVERVRRAPAYDFERPPHDGTLFYECFDWGMTGPRWRRLARRALDTLGDL